MIYHLLDYFFFLFHTLLVLFNSLGWIFRKTRKWNLIALTATLLSWFVLGIWYGWGYCPSTDWHWEVRQQLGYNDPENSYIQLLLRKLLGEPVSREFADGLTFSVFFVSLVLSVVLNVRDHRKMDSED